MFKVNIQSDNPFGSSINWRLGDKKPGFFDPSHVCSLTASDEELVHIHQYFRGVPSVMMKNEVTWRGVYAQFIYENL